MKVLLVSENKNEIFNNIIQEITSKFEINIFIKNFFQASSMFIEKWKKLYISVCFNSVYEKNEFMEQ